MNPDLVDQALLALRDGEFAKARGHMRDFAADHTYEAQHYLIDGLAALAMADWAVARDVFSAATDAFPDHAQFWFNRGLAEENLGKLAAAEASYQRSLALKPDQGEAFGNLSNIYRKLGRFPEAVQMACRALAAGVPKASALNVLGLALGKQGNFSEAAKAFDEALALVPQDGAILANRANLAVDQLKFDEAWTCFAAARAADYSPIIKRDEGMARLLAGDYATGLPLMEARLELPTALRVRPSCPRWNGESLKGKTLLLVSEQGFGDTIQFSRYVHRLVEAGAELVWIVRKPLQRLLAGNVAGRVVVEEDITCRNPGRVPLPLAGGVRGGLANTGTDFTSPPSVPPASGGEAQAASSMHDLPPADFWLPILSSPFALGMRGPALPKAPNFRAAAEPKLPDAKGKRKIGLVWSGSRTHERDHERSIALERFASLWEKIDAQFYAPFKGAAEGLKDKTTPVIPLDHLIHDFADAAALIAQLDCLITVDTAAAHLAGALGVPTFVLLPHCPDWRWGASGDKTGWYQSLTLLRQSSYGHWDSVIESLVERCAALAAKA